jgi:hypothetical protein
MVSGLIASMQPFIGVALFYNGSEEEGRRTFKSFLDLSQFCMRLDVKDALTDIWQLEPVADMCAEVPYEGVNGLNNPMVPHGFNRYTKSIFISRSQKEATPKIVERWQALSGDNSPVQFMVFHEYFVGKKISSVPSDATAFFHRQKTSHALCLVTWKENTPENFQLARKGSRQLVEPSADAENTSLEICYGNYCKMIS